MVKYIARVFIAGYRPGQEVPKEIGEANVGRFAYDGPNKIPVVEKIEVTEKKQTRKKKADDE